MADFRVLSDSVLASPQIEFHDIAEAKAVGVTLIVNNRPDGEEPSAPQGESIEAAAQAAGIDYVAIPIGHSGFGELQVEAMLAAITQLGTGGKMLAYCRSGTRSTFLWALAEAKGMVDCDAISRSAMAAGYDVTPIRPMMDMLAAR